MQKEQAQGELGSKQLIHFLAAQRTVCSQEFIVAIKCT